MSEFTELPVAENQSALLELIREKLGTDKYTYTISPGSTVGDNYLGIVYRVRAVSESPPNNTLTNGYHYPTEISIIVKLPPTNPARRKEFFARPAFIRESWVYDEILPMYRRYQESKGIVPEENGFYEAAECYKSMTDDMKEGLFFEDLKEKGFDMYDRHTDVTFEHAVLVMKALGKLHALSYAKREEDPESFVDIKKINDMFTLRKDDKILITYMDDLLHKTRSLLDPETDGKIIERFDELMKRSAIDVLVDVVNGNAAEPYAVLCHGDCWNNNILYKNQDGKPTELRLLDWQIARYASPACDLTYYLFICASKDVREKYYDELLQIYHKSLTDLLKRLGFDSGQLFPYSALLDQLKQFGKFGLIMAAMILPIINTHKDDVPNLDEIAEKMSKGDEKVEELFSTSGAGLDAFNRKMRYVILDLYRFGYI